MNQENKFFIFSTDGEDFHLAKMEFTLPTQQEKKKKTKLVSANVNHVIPGEVITQESGFLRYGGGCRDVREASSPLIPDACPGGMAPSCRTISSWPPSVGS